jgi:ACT domain-containing protein
MKKMIILITMISSILTLPAFAANDLEANSLIQCKEASSISQAVADINTTLASPFLNIASGISDGSYFKIQNYISSQPTITKLDNGKFSVCVTLTRKNGWLSSTTK